MPSVYQDAYERAKSGVFRPGADSTYADGDDSSWMEVDWPAITCRLEIEGRSVGFVDTGGDGPPLVFIHGLGGIWQNWLLNLPVFMRTHRCIAVDLPGFGLSDELEEASIPGFARVVDRLSAELGIEEPTVIGNSMGGFVGAELAVRFPTRVSKLVLVAAAGLSTEYLANQPLLAGARAFMMLTARTGLRGNGMVRRPRSRRLALQIVVRYPEKLSAALATELIQGANAPGFIDSFEALLTYSYRDRLERIEVPTLIVWGRNDMLVPAADAEAYEHLIGENAHSVIFEDTGHLPMLERPSRFNDLLRSFLAGERDPETDVTGATPL